MITPRKGLFVVALVLLLCGLLNARWTGWLTRPMNSVVRTLTYPAGWVGSQVKSDAPAQSAYTGDIDLVEKLELANARNAELWIVNERLREQIESFEAVVEIKDNGSFRMVESRVGRVNNDPANPTMELLRGSLHGLQSDDAVLYRSNLIGFVTKDVGPTTATVSLITRPGFSVEVQIQPPSNVPVGEGWPVITRVETDSDGRFYCDLRINVGDAMRPGDEVRVSDDLYESAIGFILGLVDEVARHPDRPELLRRVYIRPRTRIGEQSRVTVITEPTD